jgi:CBS domain-containing protein
VKDKDMMIADHPCCTPEHSCGKLSRAMVRHDCGKIVIVESELKPIGVITDGDIAWRVVAADKSPTQTNVHPVTVATEPFYGALALESKGVK